MNDSDDHDDAAPAASSHAPPPDRPGPSAPAPAATTEVSDRVDLDAIERDLGGVATALERLDAGTYWTDEVTGEAIPEARLSADPVARRSS